MITGAQLRAARGLLDLSREELAQAAKISSVTVKNIEHGTFSPNQYTNAVIKQVLESRDVMFTEDQGVKFSKGTVSTFTGSKGYPQFLDDILYTMRDGGNTRQFNFSDSLIIKHGSNRIAEYAEKMKAVSNLDARCLVPEGDRNFPIKHCQYKWLPKTSAIPYFLYGNKIAMLTSAPEAEMVWVSIYSEHLATAYLERFDFFWQEALSIPAKRK